MEFIDILAYEKCMNNLLLQLTDCSSEIDCIVCIKRSGFILGAFLSNKLDKPLFTQSEVGSIPSKFRRILLVDDKIQTGKTFNKTYNKLIGEGFRVKTACLFVQGRFLTHYFSNFIGSRISLWYEN